MAKPKKKPAALYARVSTYEQSADSQLDTLRAWAEREGYEVREFVDTGESGAKVRRSELDRLLTAVRRREIAVVACTKLDRLARSLRQLVDLADEFKERDVDLVTTDQAIDTTTPAGELTFHVLGAVAQFERALIAARTRAGLRAARRRGKRIGRPRARVPERRAPDMHQAGIPVAQIARELHCSRSSLRRRLGLLS